MPDRRYSRCGVACRSAGGPSCTDTDEGVEAKSGLVRRRTGARL